MPSPRTGLNSTLVERNDEDVRYFLKVNLASPLYLTDGETVTLDIDGTGAVEWESDDFILGPIGQAWQSKKSVSWLEFGNADDFWTTLSNSPGLMGVEVEVWRGQFHPDTGVLDSAVPFFRGKFDDGSYGLRAKITLRASDTNWSKMVPWKVTSPLCVHNYKDEFCQYAGAEPGAELTCGKTREACNARSNLINFTAADLMPAPGTELTYTIWED